MTLALIAMTVLAVVIFAYVLEPIVRGRSDRAVLDAAVLPEHDEQFDDDDVTEPIDGEPASALDGDERQGRRRVAIDRPAGSDAS